MAGKRLHVCELHVHLFEVNPNRQQTGTLCTVDKNTSLRGLWFFTGKMFCKTCRILVGGKPCFLVNAGKESRKQESRVHTVMFPGGSILRWQEPVTITGFSPLHLGSAAYQLSCSCFHMWAMFLLVHFFLPSRFFVLSTWTWHCFPCLCSRLEWLAMTKGVSSSILKKEWWPLRQLSFTISHALFTSTNFYSL